MWSTLESPLVSVTLYFRGITPSPCRLLMTAGQRVSDIIRVSNTLAAGPVEIAPSAKVIACTVDAVCFALLCFAFILSYYLVSCPRHHTVSPLSFLFFLSLILSSLSFFLFIFYFTSSLSSLFCIIFIFSLINGRL